MSLEATVFDTFDGGFVSLADTDGTTTPIGSRTGFWFSIVTAFAGVEVRSR